MKRLGKFLIAAALMTMVFAVPVLAEDKIEDRSETLVSSENTDDLVRQLDEHNVRAMGQVFYVANFNSFAAPYAPHALVVSKQVKDYDILCCDNHMLYLNSVLSAAVSDLENKQAQYNNAASQAAGNPTYAGLLPECEAQLKAAQQKVIDTQNRIAIAKVKLAKYYDATIY